MKKYFTKLPGNNETNEVELIDDNKFLFKGKEYEFEHEFISDNVIVLRINNMNYIVKTDYDIENNYGQNGTENSGTSFNIDIKSYNYKLECKGELDLLIEKFSNNKAGSRFKNSISSPMPGAIVKLNIKPGQRVKKDDVLLVLEAMKMENEIKANRDCVVKEVLVKEKSSVDKGQVLVKLDTGDK
jgi:biotin carboxyl carrier protein